ncbi:MAG TPA: DnaJ domain-containing protein [Thermoanaerobaculia bacterium]|nr:DnaJ domain-containing protein [Thermoanaerobaculia bacterium]HMF07773.1 DnaJ domain-containing protein [Thermoanaerobaculia bacterium]
MPRDIDYYALLGVDREATEAEIRERFRSLARETHPDRVPNWRREKAEADFQEIAQAVNVLTNADRRKAYDYELSMAKAAADAGETDSVVADYISHGIAAYREKRYVEAAGNFSLAIRRAPNDARAHHYLGLASARAGDVRAAIRALEAAIALDPNNSRLLADAGAVFRQAGLLVKAEKAYQEAMRWDPTASDLRRALEEVREQRAGKERAL